MYFLGFMKDISGIEEKLHTWTVFKSRFELKCNIHRKLRTRELTEIHRKKFWLLACVIFHDIIFFVSSSEAQIFPFSLISLSVVVIDSINTDFPTISVILEPKYDHFYFWDKNHCNTQPNDLFTIIFTLFFTDTRFSDAVTTILINYWPRASSFSVWCLFCLHLNTFNFQIFKLVTSMFVQST